MKRNTKIIALRIAYIIYAIICAFLARNYYYGSKFTFGSIIFMLVVVAVVMSIKETYIYHIEHQIMILVLLIILIKPVSYVISYVLAFGMWLFSLVVGIFKFFL